MRDRRISPGALARLAGARDVVIVGHVNPDADSVCGALALATRYRDAGGHAVAITPNALPEALRLLPGGDTLQVAPESVERPDLVIAVDSGSYDRIAGGLLGARAWIDSVPLVNIDHHISNSGYGAEQVIDPDAASVCEVLYELFGELSWEITPTIARHLLTGVISDTRGFRTSSTTARSLRIGSALVDRGAPLTVVADAVHRYRVAAELPLWGLVLERVERQDDVLWSHVTHRDATRFGLDLADIDGLVGFLADTRDVHVAVLFTAHADDRVRVSLRADEGVDVARVAQQFGGGGHRAAAGCTIEGVDLRTAIERIISAVRDALASGADA